MIRKYGKAIGAVLATAVVAGVRLWTGDHSISPAEWAQIAVFGTGAVTTYVVPIVPQFPAIKTVNSLIWTLAGVCTVILLDGLDANDVGLLVTEAALFFGIAIAPADSSKLTGAAVGWGSDRVIDGTFVERTGPVR